MSTTPANPSATSAYANRRNLALIRQHGFTLADLVSSAR